MKKIIREMPLVFSYAEKSKPKSNMIFRKASTSKKHSTNLYYLKPFWKPIVPIANGLKKSK